MRYREETSYSQSVKLCKFSPIWRVVWDNQLNNIAHRAQEGKVDTIEIIEHLEEAYANDSSLEFINEAAKALAKLAAMESQEPTHIIDWEFDDDPDDVEARGDLIIHQLNGAEYPAGTPLYANPVPAEQVPDGWKLVPIEPTSEMRRKAGLHRGADYYTIRKVWREMLAAAPSHSQQG